jgi:hypothetical protein
MLLPDTQEGITSPDGIHCKAVTGKTFGGHARSSWSVMFALNDSSVLASGKGL